MRFILNTSLLFVMIGTISHSAMAKDIELDFDIDMDMKESAETFAPKVVDRDFVRGWIDYRTSSRYNDHPANDNQVLNELRAQIETVNYFSGFETHLRVDGLIDESLNDESIDVREAYVKLAPAKWLDISAGRQVMLWSTADLIFVNDLFPKDYVSFYAGRDAEQEYLMLPLDGVSFNFYSQAGEFDFVYQTEFKPYATPTGERLSFYNPLVGDIVGNQQIFYPQDNDDDVLYARYLAEIGTVEFGIYAYDGYWYAPFGFDTTTGKAYYPKLQSLGFSGRASVAGGIITGEVAYYNSPEDNDGSNAYVPNDSLRAYAGYEHEIVKDLTMSAQLYVEQIQQYNNYVASGGTDKKIYDMWTVRLTQFLMKQTLTLSAFMFYSPTEKDYYTRLNVFYAPSDKWMINVGLNDFGGKIATTRFAQLEQNSAVFASVKYKF